MRKERALLLIQRSNRLYIRAVQNEIKHIEILCHPFLMNRLWNYNNILLYQITKCYLRRCFPIYGADIIQDRICKEILPAFRKGPQDSCCTRYFSIVSCALTCWLNTWVSILSDKTGGLVGASACFAYLLWLKAILQSIVLIFGCQYAQLFPFLSVLL